MKQIAKPKEGPHPGASPGSRVRKTGTTKVPEASLLVFFSLQYFLSNIFSLQDFSLSKGLRFFFLSKIFASGSFFIFSSTFFGGQFEGQASFQGQDLGSPAGAGFDVI